MNESTAKPDDIAFKIEHDFVNILIGTKYARFPFSPMDTEEQFLENLMNAGKALLQELV